MRYRNAKNLLNGDEVERKVDKQIMTVVDIEVYGQYKKVKINCVDVVGSHISLFNDEVE